MHFVQQALALTLALLLIAGSAGATTQKDRTKEQEAARKKLNQGISIFRQGKYKQAANCFHEATRYDSRDVKAQYYYGVCSLKAKDLRAAKFAFLKVVAMTSKSDPYHAKAASALSSYYKLYTYSVLQPAMKPPKIVRWDKRRMPLKVLVTDGRNLPDKYDANKLSPKQVGEIGAHLKNIEYVKGLKKSQTYMKQYGSSVVAGIRLWDWAVGERLISYSLTTRYDKADIVVFWDDNLKDCQSRTYLPLEGRRKHGAAIVVLSLSRAAELKEKLAPQMVVSGAHGFGRALGLPESPFKYDLMASSNPTEGQRRETRKVSGADKNALRALYLLESDILL